MKVHDITVAVSKSASRLDSIDITATAYVDEEDDLESQKNLVGTIQKAIESIDLGKDNTETIEKTYDVASADDFKDQLGNNRTAQETDDRLKLYLFDYRQRTVYLVLAYNERQAADLCGIELGEWATTYLGFADPDLGEEPRTIYPRY